MNKELIKIYYSNLKDKNIILSKEWEKYFKENKGFKNSADYELYLVMKETSFIVDINVKRYKIDKEKIIEIVKKLQNNKHVTEREAISLLEFAVENARKGFEKIGLDLNNSSLDGFAELGQILSIRMFEDIGLKVTKNKAVTCFNSYFYNVFGTVTIPIKEDGKVEEKVFLIDTTYKQYFSSVDCNEGKKYILNSKYPVIPHISPGYYVKDKNMAKHLINNGYIELNENIAKEYGKAFVLASSNPEKFNDIDYFSTIVNDKNDYAMRLEDIDELNISFASEDKIKKM